MLERGGEYQTQKYQEGHGVVDELGIRMFVQLPELPAPNFLQFVAAIASPYQSNKNVNETSNYHENKLKKEPRGFFHCALILPISPSTVNDLIENKLTFGARYELEANRILIIYYQLLF